MAAHLIELFLLVSKSFSYNPWTKAMVIVDELVSWGLSLMAQEAAKNRSMMSWKPTGHLSTGILPDLDQHRYTQKQTVILSFLL